MSDIERMYYILKDLIPSPSADDEKTSSSSNKDSKTSPVSSQDVKIIPPSSKFNDSESLPTSNDSESLPGLNDSESLPISNDSESLPKLNSTSLSSKFNSTSTLPGLNDNIISPSSKLNNTSPTVDTSSNTTKFLPPAYWSTSVLPLSYYLSKISLRDSKKRLYEYKASTAESLDIFTIRPRKLASLLTQLDIFLLQNIKPGDLLTSYISYLSTKNTGLINYISSLLNKEEAHSYFIKVLYYLIDGGNYNSAGCLKKAFLRHKLSRKILIKLDYEDKSSHNDISHNNKASHYDMIPPFEIFIKDLEDSSNLNSVSTSLRFCQIVELLVSLQNKKIKINKKREHFLLYKIWKHMDEEEESREVDRDDYLYLYL